MNPLKSLGLDGLHVLFFQSQWQSIGDLVCDPILEIFKDPKRVKKINDSILVLIAKVDNFEHIKQFGPMGLCNVIHKIVTKIIPNRLKPYLSYLIFLNQCNFALGRHSSNNIIIV